MGKTVTKSLNGGGGGGLAVKDTFDYMIPLMKTIDPSGLSAPIPGLYTCVWSPFSNIVSPKTACIAASGTQALYK